MRIGVTVLCGLIAVVCLAACEEKKPDAKPSTSAPAATATAHASAAAPAKAPAPAGGW